MTKRNRIIYWVSTLWLSLGMLATGAAQLFKIKEGQGGADMIAHLGYPIYFLILIGIWKLLGITALLVPRLPLVKEWAYAGFFFAMSGAIISHIAAGNSISETFPALLLLMLTVVSWHFRPSDKRIISMNQ